MTEATSTDDAATDASADATGGQQASNYTPPATQADLDRIIAERLSRQKAQFADYGEAKAKAAEFDKLQEANQTESQRQAAEVAKWQTEAETWRGQAVAARIEALAADYADPSDASTALAGRNYLDAGGQIDENAIRADLAEVLEKKPHWRKGSDEPSGSRPPIPNLAQGTSGTAAHASPRDQFAALIQGRT